MPALKLNRSAPPPPAAAEFAVLPENVEPVTVRVPLDGVLMSGSPALYPNPPPLLVVELPEKVVPVIVRLPPSCEMPPPPNVPAPVAELPEIMQFVIDTVLLIEPEIMPPPPTPVVSFPPVIVTSEIEKLKLASKFGLTSITRSFGAVC